MAATTDEEMDSLLSTVDQIYQVLYSVPKRAFFSVSLINTLIFSGFQQRRSGNPIGEIHVQCRGSETSSS